MTRVFLSPGGRDQRAHQGPDDRPRTQEQGGPHQVSGEPEIPVRLRF